MLTELASFLRCSYRQGLRNSVLLDIGKHGRTRLLPRGHKFPFTIRADTVDAAIFRQVFVDREYEHAILGTVDPKQIIDAGAHIGSASIFFAEKFPNARIIALEPDAGNFELLESNTKPYSNIIPINAALWCEDTYVSLRNVDNTSWAFRVEAKQSGIVRALSLATLFKQFNLARVDILKMDVEGAEKEIFEKSEGDWLSKVELLCIELHDRIRPGAARAVYSRVVAFPFVKESHGELDFVRFVDAGA